jgi:peptidoglycan/LPS O-acetylase OafA/YrhL
LFIFHSSFFALILTLVAAGTFFTSLKSQSTFVNYLQCFSLSRNFKSLTNLSTDKSTIGCMNGIKVLATAAITYFHYFMLRMAYPFKDSSESYGIINESLYYTFSMSFAVYIEAFFIMSGLLLGRSLKNGEKIDFWKMLLQRYMRLTPSVFVLILMLGISVTFVSNGQAPYLFPKTAIENWYNYGYTTLLHLEIYTNPKNMVTINNCRS